MAAYAVILRDDHILLSRLAKRLTSKELWTLPGGGLEHGEDPRDAVVREVHEETGLDVVIDETAHVYSYHQRNTWRQGRRADAHALRIVYDGWVPLDSPEPHVVEIDGSTMEAAWQPVAGVLDGTVPVVGLVTEVLAEHRPFQLQRVAAYALAVRDGDDGQEVLLTRNSAARPAPGLVDAPGRRHRPRRGAAGGAGPRGPRGDGARMPPRRGPGRRLHPLRGHRPVGATGGLPLAADRLRRDGLRGRACRPGGRRHHRRGRVGAGVDPRRRPLPDPRRGPVGARRPRA